MVERYAGGVEGVKPGLEQVTVFLEQTPIGGRARLVA